MKKILITTGDYSADLHGEALVLALRKREPNLHVTALGGVRLKSVADEFLRDLVEMDVSGFTQPFKQFFKLKDILQNAVFPRIDSGGLDAVIPIDYYGFNNHVAARAKAKGVPVFYFVSPQVWASRGGRIQKLKACVTRMLVIFPFEEALYKKHAVPVTFVGHPLMDRIAGLTDRLRTAPDPEKDLVRIGLMPGSRQRELVQHIPLMLETCRILRKKFKRLEATLFAVDSLPDDYYRSFLGSEPVRLARESGFQIRLEQDLCLTASGTATLENALLGLPMVVVYRTSFLTYWVAKKIIQVPYISMPNLLAGKAVVPEMIQHAAAPEAVAETAAGILGDPGRLERMQGELIQLRRTLGEPGAYDRAADLILKSLKP